MYSVTYSICNDASGNSCTEIGVDTYKYTIATKKSTPKYYSINVSSLVAQFKKCNGSLGKLINPLLR